MGVRARRGGTGERADGLDDPPLAADDLAGVLLVHAELHEDGAVLGIARLDLQLIGKLDERAHDGLDEAEIKRRMAEKIEKNSEREKARMETLISPHRDDIIYEINGKEAKAYASQGQQKTIVLVEKLAEVELISREIGESPVLLLDDIMSELDKKRQAFILSNIKGMQIIITCTDIEEFGNLDNFNRIYVENAVISAKGYNKPETAAN